VPPQQLSTAAGNNVVFGNAASGIHMNGDVNTGDTSVPGIDGVIRNAVVEGNIIRGNGGGSAFTAGGGSGINADGVQASAIRNNLLYDNHASGVSLFRQDGGGGSSGNAVVNNTIINAADSRWALNITGGSTGNTVFNNILYDLNTFSLRGAMTVSADSLSGLASNYNFVDPRFGIDEDPRTLAQWRAQTGNDLNSTALTQAQLQALFANYAGNDFTLAANSAAINAGVMGLLNGSTLVGAPPTDLLGTPRPQGGFYDVGAYEATTTSVPEPGGTSVIAAAMVLAAVAAGGRRTRRRPRVG
jgi:MYXO-CTERM domain-containing protein